MFILELDTREPVKGGVTHGPRVPSILTLTEKVLVVLFAHAAVLAGVGVTSVCHAARVNDDILVHNLLSHLPRGRGFVLTINHNPPHAADEAGVTIETPANAVIRSCPYLNDPVGQHPDLEKNMLFISKNDPCTLKMHLSKGFPSAKINSSL